ncbi:MAG: sodium:solute symporter family protein [Firmicutes bacterium]|nr:sodium:solute symporter family protein [Bacillota bacterium]
MFVISAFFIKKTLNSFEEYGYCGRSLSIGFIFFTYLGTWIGGGTIVGLISRGYDFGASQYWIIALSCVVEIFFALFFIGKIRQSELKSITDFFAVRYPDKDEIVRIPVSAAILIRNITMIAMQFSALSYLITFIFGINRNLSLLLVFLVVISYTVLSGLWGVAVTDVFQGILQTIGIISLCVITYKLCGGLDFTKTFYDAAGMSEHLNLFHVSDSWYSLFLFVGAYGLFFLMNDQTNWERIYASKSTKTAKWGFAVPLTVTLISLVAIVYIGVFQRVLVAPYSGSSYILYHFIFTIMESKWSILILVALLASIMSTADSFLLASGITLSENVIKTFIIKDATDKEQIFFTRIFVIATGSMAFAFSLNTDDILGLWMTGIGMTSVILLPGYFMGWLKQRPHTRAILAGMAAGIVYDLAMIFTPLGMDAEHICIGILLNLIICFVATPFVRKEARL